MAIIRNVTTGPLVITVGKGRVIHLLTGRAVALTEQEQQVSQVRNLISRGDLRMVEVKKKDSKSAPIKTVEQEKKAEPVKSGASESKKKK